jgi:hypothetical protein
MPESEGYPIGFEKNQILRGASVKNALKKGGRGDI